MTNNQLAENSVNQLLNSVRLARDNAERADNRVDHSFYFALTIALEELQERRKADSEPAPVVPEKCPAEIRDLISSHSDALFNDDDAQEIWNACRASMLQTGNSPVIPDGSEHCPCCGKKLRRACSVEGCGGKHVAHGLCKKHYDMKRWEDPEQVRKFREAGKRYRRKTKSAAAAPQEVK